jgi:arsenical pump membrane protein
LIVTDRFHLSVGDVLARLAVPSVVASAAGWLMYRRRFPTRLAAGAGVNPDRHALTVGGVVVVALLVGFVVGPSVGLEPWMVAAAADVVLMVVVRFVPSRDVPLLTAAGVAALAAIAAVVVPSDALTDALRHDSPLALMGVALAAGGVANMVNNLPALLLALDSVDQMSWGMWAWLLGVNTGAVLLPLGALANLLWLRIMRAEGIRVSLRRYVGISFPIAFPAFVAAVGTLAAERALFG